MTLLSWPRALAAQTANEEAADGNNKLRAGTRPGERVSKIEVFFLMQFRVLQGKQATKLTPKK